MYEEGSNSGMMEIKKLGASSPNTVMKHRMMSCSAKNGIGTL
jgi:hypothetical protein